jgi:hypothetical protein
VHRLESAAISARCRTADLEPEFDL